MTWWILFPPGFHYFKRFVILCYNLKFSVRNLSCFFDIKNPRRKENLQSQYTILSEPIFKILKNLWSAPFPLQNAHIFKVLNLDKPLAILTTVLTFGAGSSKASSLLIWAPRDSIMNHGWMDLIHVERILTISSR